MPAHNHQAMGGGPPTEHLLCALPFPEPKELTNHLRSKFPQIDITYYQVSFTADPGGSEDSIAQNAFKDTTILFTFASLPKTKNRVFCWNMI